MPYALPTVADFKRTFIRDFPFSVPAYGAAGKLTIVGGAVTAAALLDGGTGYATEPTVDVVDATGSGAAIVATIDKGRVTGFTVSNGGSNYSDAATLRIRGGAGDESNVEAVRDADIDDAILDASYNVNQSLFEDELHFQRAFLFLAAHCLVERLLAAGEGVMSRYRWLVTATKVGDISESFEIPDAIKESAFLSSVSKTRYGARYLEIISPLLIGNMQALFRQSLPS